MDNWQMIGGSVFALSSILALVKAINSLSYKDREVTRQNTDQLILLNNNFEHMRERDKERDELTKRSIDRLDTLSQRVDGHTYEIKRLNDTVFIKDRN